MNVRCILSRTFSIVCEGVYHFTYEEERSCTGLKLLLKFFIPFYHMICGQILYFCNKLEKSTFGVIWENFHQNFQKRRKRKFSFQPYTCIVPIAHEKFKCVPNFQYTVSNDKDILYVTRLQYYVLIWSLLSAMYALFKSVSGVLSQFIMQFIWSIRKQYFPIEGLFSSFLMRLTPRPLRPDSCVLYPEFLIIVIIKIFFPELKI